MEGTTMYLILDNGPLYGNVQIRDGDTALPSLTRGPDTLSDKDSRGGKLRVLLNPLLFSIINNGETSNGTEKIADLESGKESRFISEGSKKVKRSVKYY